MSDNSNIYFSGKKLYGDDFSIDEINEWFKDEQEGYSSIGVKDRKNYRYEYHQLNIYHGYSHIKEHYFKKALGIGAAYGDELLPIIDKIQSVTILDPSDTFSLTSEIKGTPCEYVKPNPNGNLPFNNSQFDLITSLGVMHHIPNVSKVMSECYRCLNTEGIMLIREPIVTMGDWTKPRFGLTKNERGIPLEIFEEIIQLSGFSIKNKALCNFPPIPKLTNQFNIDAYNNKAITFLDFILSQAFSWNIKYHRKNILEKLAPASVYFILEKK